MENWLLWTVFGAVIFGCWRSTSAIFHKKAHEVSVREALLWTSVWIAVGLAFCVAIVFVVVPSAMSGEERPSARVPDLLPDGVRALRRQTSSSSC